MLKARPTMELQITVRDGAGTLARCLKRAAPLVDRVPLGDTGLSTRSGIVGLAHATGTGVDDEQQI